MDDFQLRRRIALILALLLWSPTVVAETLKGAAGRKRCNTMLFKGELRPARKCYEELRATNPSYKLDFNLAQVHDKLGDACRAISYFDLFLKKEKGRAPAGFTSLAQSRLSALGSKVGHLLIKGGGPGAVVKVDRVEKGRTPLDEEICLPLGEHEVEIIPAGKGMPQRHSFRLEPGGRKEIPVKESPKLEPEDPPEAPPLTGPDTDPGTDSSSDTEIGSPPGTMPGPQSERRTSSKSDSAKTIAGYTVLGLGLASVATAAVLYGVGGRQGAEAHDNYLEASNTEDVGRYHDEVEAAKVKLIAGHVLAGVGVAALGVAIYLLLTRPDAAEESAESEAGFSPQPGGGLITFRGRF